MIPPIGGIGAGLTSAVGETASATQPLAAEGAQAGQGAQAVGGGEAAGSGGFGGELTEAISSLEKGQDSASAASQALATGNVKDPESAVVTVENAVMEMDLASEIRGKATEAAQTIFQTQV